MSDEVLSRRPAPDPKKTIVAAIVGIVTLVIIFWKVIPRIGSYEDAWLDIQSMTWFAIVPWTAVVLYNVTYGFPFMTSTGPQL